MTKEEPIKLLQASDLPEFCITDEYVESMLQKSDTEIFDEIAHINSFWDTQYAQHRYGQGKK
jgi:hypothetical protein